MSIHYHSTLKRHLFKIVYPFASLQVIPSNVFKDFNFCMQKNCEMNLKY